MARTWTLGLMLPNLTNPMYAEIIRAAEQRARERGFGLVFGTHVDGEEEATFVRLLQEGRVDGLLTASGVHGDRFLRRIANGGFGPMVMLNRRVRGVHPTVTVDDAAGAALAVRASRRAWTQDRRRHFRPGLDRDQPPPPRRLRRGGREGRRHRRSASTSRASTPRSAAPPPN